MSLTTKGFRALFVVILALVLLRCSAIPSASNGDKASGNQGILSRKKLVIRKAVYGDLPEGVTIDVTDKVSAMVKNDTLTVEASDKNFGDPYNGKMNLTITRAVAKLPHAYSTDITEQIKKFQEGNRLQMKDAKGMTLTVYYKYGEGEISVKELADDGSINIVPPTKLRVDYTFNGIDMSKTVDFDYTLELNGKGNSEITPSRIAGRTEVGRANNGSDSRTGTSKSNGPTPEQLDDALRDDSVERVKALLKARPDLAFNRDADGSTPLELVASWDYKDVAELLLAHGANASAKDARSGYSPLHFAAAYGFEDMAELLLAHGADVNAINKDGQTPLHFAVDGRHKELAELLRRYGGHE